MTTPLDIIVLAAGKGTRMKSRLPKVLQRLAGRPMLGHVLDAAAQLGARRCVVVTGHGAQEVQAFCAGWHAQASAQANQRAGAMQCLTALQQPQLGTGHAAQQALPLLDDGGITLILSGDVPLIQPATLGALAQACGGRRLALLTIDFEDPTGYGRVIRSGESVQAIVEQKDATPAQLAVRECYSGIMAAPTALLRRLLPLLSSDNAQQEFYLTDVVRHAVAAGEAVTALKTADAAQVAGVNSPAQLAALEREAQCRMADALMAQGVRLADPARLDVRGTLECGQDVEIDIGCLFEGHVSLGDGVRIGAHCVIANACIEAGARIHPFTHIDGGAPQGVRVGAGALIGPYARLRPGAQLGADVHIGNFVEVKNSTLAPGAKANHLAYLGDATVGERVNYGAGSITANYDGARKHRTTIGADVHVGSNCVLVAPVTLGAGGTVAAGSVITQDTAPGALTIARGRQSSLPGWQRPAKPSKG